MVYFDIHESDTLLGVKIPKPKLTEDEKLNLYLKKFYTGEIAGPLTGYATKDRPWLKSYTEDEIAMVLPEVSVYSYLYRNNVADPNKAALNYNNEKITYKKLFEKIDKVAKALKQNGVKDDDVITLSMPNSLEFVYLFYAISKIGSTIHIIDSNTDIKDIEKYIKAVNSTMTFITDKDYEKFKPLIDNETINKSVVIPHKVKYVSDLFKNYKVDYNDKTVNWKTFIDEGKKYENLNAKLEYKKNRPFLITHTLGTAGDKKTVVLTNENINAASLQCSISGINIEKGEKWLNTLSNYRITGITLGIHLPLSNGIETILMPEYDMDKFEQVLLKNKPNHIIGTYRCYKDMLNNYKLMNKNFSFLKTPIVVDNMYTNLEEKTNKFLEQHNCKSRVLKGYGMTELSGAIAGTPHKNNEFGSVGIPFTKTIVGIFAPGTDKEIKYGYDGEICISGPSIMNGYFNDQELTDKVIGKHKDGRLWLHTGDIGYINEDGVLYVNDRLEKWQNRKWDLKYFPRILEETLGMYYSIVGCKVVTYTDVKHNKTFEANLVLNERFKGLDDVVVRPIQALCQREFPEYYDLITYKFVDSLDEVKETEKVKTL